MKQLYKLLLFAAIAATALPAAAYDFMVDGIAYNINADGNTVTVTSGGTRNSGSLTIPSSVTYSGKTYSVTSIGSGAFDGCSRFTGSLTIPESVTTINYAAFSGCSGFTGTLTIPNSVTRIGERAFYGCSGFTGSLTIGNSVTSIGENAFDGCSGFTGSLTIGNSVTSISSRALQGCSGFNKLIFNATYCIDFSSIPPYNPFTDLAFTEVVIGNGVQHIPAYFLSCINKSNLTGSLTIPESVTSIGKNAFMNCSGFTKLVFNAVNCNNFRDDSFQFTGMEDTEVVIGNSVQHIPAYFLYRRTEFSGSLTIPNSVTSIGALAFYGCSGFTGSLTIGNSVTSIGYGAFNGCVRFNKLVFNAVNCVDFGNSPASPFAGLAATELVIGNSVQHIPSYLLNKCSNFTGSLTIPESVTAIGYSAFQDCGGFTGSLTIPNSVTSIGNDAFSGCSGFTGPLTIGNSVTSIGNKTFYGCSGITDITIPSDLADIGSSAFDDTGWYNNQPDGVVYIGNVAYKYKGTVPSGSTLTLRNGIKGIAGSAFSGCTGFTGSLTIPNSVTTIGDYAFSGCSGLSKVLSYSTTPASAGTDAFYEVAGNCPLYVPIGTTQSYQSADQWSGFNPIIERNLAVPEDVNSDNAVDINDVNEMLNCILERPSDNRDFADTNFDNKVNVIDLNEIIEYILSH